MITDTDIDIDNDNVANIDNNKIKPLTSLFLELDDTRSRMLIEQIKNFNHKYLIGDSDKIGTKLLIKFGAKKQKRYLELSHNPVIIFQ